MKPAKYKLTRSHLIRMKTHLELLKVVPLLGLHLFKIVIEVPGTEPKRVEVSIWFEEEGSGCFLVGDSRISSLPFPHHVDAVWIPGEGEGIATVCGTKVYGSHNEVFVGWRRAARGRAAVADDRLQCDVDWRVASRREFVQGGRGGRMDLLNVAVVAVIAILVCHIWLYLKGFPASTSELRFSLLVKLL